MLEFSLTLHHCQSYKKKRDLCLLFLRGATLSCKCNRAGKPKLVVITHVPAVPEDEREYIILLLQRAMKCGMFYFLLLCQSQYQLGINNK